MAFWKLDGTGYVSDYKYSFVNGQVEAPYTLPSVRCKVCRHYMGGGIMLPYRCPANLRRGFSDPPDATIEEFNRLAKRVKVAVGKKGFSASLVQPGAVLEPIFLDIASKPTADFLWPGLSALVSDRIRDKLESLKVRDIAFAEVTLRKVGKQSAKVAPPIPYTGEPEDIVNEVPTTRFPKKERGYSRLCIYGRSSPPPGRELLSVCSACGGETYNWTRGRELIMTDSMWTGGDMFILETTGIILVTDALRRALQELRPTNVEFSRFPSAIP
jgi:hypothetical protein